MINDTINANPGPICIAENNMNRFDAQSFCVMDESGCNKFFWELNDAGKNQTDPFIGFSGVR